MAEIPEGILKKGGAFGKSYEAQSVEAYVRELQLEIAEAQDRAKKNLEKYNTAKKELDEAKQKIEMLEIELSGHPISRDASGSGDNAGDQTADQKIEDLEKALVRKDHEIREKAAEIKELRKKTEKLEKAAEKPQSADMELINKQIESLKQQLDESNEALSEANDLLESKQKQIDDLRMQQNALSDQQALQMELHALQQKNAALIEQIRALQTDAAALREKLADAAGKPTMDNSVLQAFQEKLAAISRERDEMFADKERAVSENAALEAKLTSAVNTIQKLESSVTELEDMQKRLEETENELATAKQKIDELKSGDVDSADIEVDMTEIYAEAQKSASQIVNAAKKTAEKLKKETDSRTARKLQEAEEQAAEILNQAKTSSEKMLADANAESQRIIHEASDSVSVLQSKFQKEQDALDAIVSSVRNAIAQKLDEVSEMAHLSAGDFLKPAESSNTPDTAGQEPSETTDDTKTETADVQIAPLDEPVDAAPVSASPSEPSAEEQSAAAPNGEASDDFVFASDEIPSTSDDEPSVEVNAG